MGEPKLYRVQCVCCNIIGYPCTPHYTRLIHLYPNMNPRFKSSQKHVRSPCEPVVRYLCSVLPRLCIVDMLLFLFSTPISNKCVLWRG